MMTVFAPLPLLTISLKKPAPAASVGYNLPHKQYNGQPWVSTRGFLFNNSPFLDTYKYEANSRTISGTLGHSEI